MIHATALRLTPTLLDFAVFRHFSCTAQEAILAELPVTVFRI
jgi:hypothetical protein